MLLLLLEYKMKTDGIVRLTNEFGRLDFQIDCEKLVKVGWVGIVVVVVVDGVDRCCWMCIRVFQVIEVYKVRFFGLLGMKRGRGIGGHKYYGGRSYLLGNIPTGGVYFINFCRGRNSFN